MRYQIDLINKIETIFKKDNYVFVYGQHGMGKSTAVIEGLNKSNIATYSFNEIDKNSIEVYPLMIIAKSFSKRVNELHSDLSIELSMPIVKIKAPLNGLFSKFSRKNHIIKSLNNIFNDTEISIILSLKKLVKKGNYYLIFDNCEFINLSVINFIRKLMQSKILNNLLNNHLKLIFIENTQPNSEMSYIKQMINHHIVVDIGHLEYTEFIRTLLPYKNLNSDIWQLIEVISTRDLNITKVLFDYFDKNMIDSDFLSNKKDAEKLAQIFDNVIFTHLNNYTKELDCLKVASILGTIMSSYDLAELTNEDIDFIELTLSFGETTGILKHQSQNSNIVSFLHPIIREIFYKKLSNKKEHHMHYDLLLKSNHPTKHLLIVENLYKGQVDTQQILHHFLSQLIILALNKTLSDFDTKKYISIYFKNSLDKIFITDFNKALLDYEKCQYIECLNFIKNIRLLQISDLFSSILLDYVEARSILIIGKTDSDFQRVKELLIKCSSAFLKEKIYDLYFDCLTVLLNVYAYKLSDLNSAREIEIEYSKQYHIVMKTANSDDLFNMYIEFLRRSTSLLDAESAFNRMKMLFEKFDFEDYLPKYKALNDMVAYSLYAGEFDTAQKYVRELNHYIGINQYYQFPEIYKYENNTVLSNIFNCDPNSTICKKEIKKGISMLSKYENHIGISNVIKLNLASLYILNNDIGNAEKRLIDLYNSLGEYSNALYRTFVPTNLAALYLIKKEYDIALNYIQEAKNYINMWDDNYRIYYKYQNDYLFRLIDRKLEVSPLDLLKNDNTKSISAKTYKFIGRGLLFSELLFYTL
ncbi:MAG: hypothetical protein NC548_42875 [Lachnospiraceae bacterium]|nr:hypothetical protein [Lachnospiraceae bacterium]